MKTLLTLTLLFVACNLQAQPIVRNLPIARATQNTYPELNAGTIKFSDGSDLINAGVNVGQPYLGTAPDIGAFEKQ